MLVLTDNNYDTFMEGKDTVLIEFYAPWYVCLFLSLTVPRFPVLRDFTACLLLSISLQIFNISIFFVLFLGVATANSLPQSMKKSPRL